MGVDMSEVTRSFIGCNINEYGEFKLKNFIDVLPNDEVYMLLKTNCIEIRTKKQHEVLLKKISKLNSLTGDDKYKRLYANIFTYSVSLTVNAIGEIRLGKSVVVNRGFDKNIIVEKCDDCIKIWNPRMFKKELDEYNIKTTKKNI